MADRPRGADRSAADGASTSGAGSPRGSPLPVSRGSPIRFLPDRDAGLQRALTWFDSLAKRTLLALFTLWGVTVLIFILFQALPGDAAVSLLGSQAGNPEAVARMRSYLGLDRPRPCSIFHVARRHPARGPGTVRPIRPARRIAHSRQGVELHYPARREAPSSCSASASRSASSAALRERSLFDRIGMGIIVVLGMVPCVLGSGSCWSMSSRLSSMSCPPAGMYSFHDSNRTLVGPDSSRLAGPDHGDHFDDDSRAGDPRIAARNPRGAVHAGAGRARHPGPDPRLALCAAQHSADHSQRLGPFRSGWLFSGAIFTEVIFSWPGIGRLIYDAVSARDVPVALGGILVVGAIFVLANLAADVATAGLDPRRREGM